MIISVEKAKELVDFKGWTDEKIAHKLKAVEQVIRKYTNNNFQERAYRKTADIIGGLFYAEDSLFAVGDTVQVSQSELNEGLYTVTGLTISGFAVEENVVDENEVLVTKVKYPDDVIDCAVSLLEWDVKNREKIGIKSETLSRHSVTYEDSASMSNGYPNAILNSLKLYKKARF